MPQAVIELLKINYVESIVAVATVLAGAVIIKEGLEKFCRTFGIELKWVQRREAMEACQKKVSRAVDSLIERQNKLESLEADERAQRQEVDNKIVEEIAKLRQDIADLDKNLEKREAEEHFRTIRANILNFANHLNEKTEVSAELISQVYREIGEYEFLVHNYGFKNNQVNASIEVITQKYQSMLLNGQIISAEDK